MRVGVLFPLSGEAGAWGRECADGVLSAVDLHGGTDVTVADALDPGAAERLVTGDGATLVFGTLFTALARSASETVISRGAAYAEVAAVADELGERGLERFFRTGPRASAFAARAVGLARESLGARSAVVIHEDSAFGRSLGGATAAQLRAAGIDVLEEIDLPAETADFGRARDAIAAHAPDAAFAASYTAFAQRLWRALRDAAHPLPAMIGVGGGWIHLHEGTPVPADRVYAIDVAASAALAPAGLLPATLRRREEYAAAHAGRGASRSVYADLGFAGADLLLGAFREAGGDADAFARLARSIAVQDGGTVLGYGASFDGSGENVRATPVVMQHQGSRLPVVLPAGLATAPPDTRPAIGT
jgi:branched-chain amino acid transport system substrate-binding protein